MMMNIIRLLRPHQYIKNGFVLLGVVFTGLSTAHALTLAGIAFIAFCAIASAAYVLNDIFDADADRQHPIKKNRPIASGEVAFATAWWLAGILSCIALILASQVSLWALGFVLIYALLNVGYSIRWKHAPVLDIFIISAGFMLRIFTGTVGLGIAPSQWLMICGLMLTLFLGFTKRRAELLALERAGVFDQALTRQVLDDYSPNMIEQFIAISAACTILSYSLYTVSADTYARHGTDALIYTVPFVVYGIYRYLFLLHQHGKGIDTALDLITDRHLLITVLSWIVVTVAVLV
jgi:4-hydroxybenzoate polyprenyltransferase